MSPNKAGLLLAVFAVSGWGQYDPPSNVRVLAYLEGTLGTASPGGVVTLTGQNLAKTTAHADGGFAESLAGTHVEVTQDGKKYGMPLARVGVREILGQMPFELTAGTAEVKVVTQLGWRVVKVKIADATPTPITYDGLAGGVVRALHDDGRLVVDAEAPAQPGERLRLAAAGLGAVEPDGKAGKRGGDGSEEAPWQRVKAAVKVLVGEHEIPAEEAVLSPEAAGEYQVTFSIPEELPPAWYSVRVKAGDAVSAVLNRVYVGPEKRRLVAGYVAGPCKEAAELRFRLAAKAWVRGIGIRAKLDGAARYRLRRGDTEVSTGVVWPRAWEAGQPDWRWGAFQWTDKELEAGEYVVELTNAAGCENPDQAGSFGLKVEGGWTESLWSGVGEGWLTPEGAALEAAGLTLTAEAGALEEPVELRVSRYEEEKDGKLVSYYRLAGLPEKWAAPLKVAVDLEGASWEEGEEAALAWKGEENNGLAPRLLRGKVEEGKLLVELPGHPASAAEGQEGKAGAWRTAGARQAARPRGVSSMLWAVMGLRWQASPKDHFIVYYPRGEEEIARSIGGKLELAYELIEGMGLEWQRRNTWPMEVFVFSYSSWSSYVLGGSGDNEGNTESELWGTEGAGLCLNLDTIRYGTKIYLEDASLTAGHELLHIMQSLYDPRGRLRKTFGHSTWLWLMEASSTWFEKALSSNDSYVPLNAVENWAFLFQRGLEAPPGLVDGAGARRHGYGASAFLQHLAPASPGVAPALVGETLKQLGVVNPVGEDLMPVPEYSPVRAIRKVLGGAEEMKEQWHQFADRYVQGEIWGSFPKAGDFLRAPVPPTQLAFSKEQKEYSTRLNLPELSAAHFLLRFPKDSAPELKENSRLKLQINDPARATRAFLYAWTAEGLLRMGSFTGQFEVEDAKSLFDSEQPLYLLLANGRNTFNGQALSEVELKLEVGEPFEGVQAVSTDTEGLCYNKDFLVKLRATMESTAPFRVLRNEKSNFCTALISVENTPWNPDDPEAQDTYTVEFSFNIEYKRDIGDIYKDWDLRAEFSTDGGQNWSQGTGGTMSFHFHRGSRSLSKDLAVRPILTKQGEKPFPLNSGDWVLMVQVNGLK